MFDFYDFLELRSKYDDLFLLSISLYIPVVFSLKYLVENYLTKNQRQTLCKVLDYPWAFWCLGLSVFSFLGTYHLSKHLLIHQKIDENVLTGNCGYYTTLFLISKIPELLDTVFIVLRSKKLVLLQWYHHWATLSVCYYTFYNFSSFVILFALMNYFVHTIMYAYYAFYTLGFKFISKYGIYITFLQTIQMLIAVGIIIYFEITGDLRFITNEYDSNTYVTISSFMYLTYLVLFTMLIFEKKKRN